jgi:hypothetical protein
MHAGVIPNVGDSWMDMPAWDANTQLAEIKVQAVPEPAPLAALGLGALFFVRKRKKA